MLLKDMAIVIKGSTIKLGYVITIEGQNLCMSLKRIFHHPSCIINLKHIYCCNFYLHVAFLANPINFN